MLIKGVVVETGEEILIRSIEEFSVHASYLPHEVGPGAHKYKAIITLVDPISDATNLSCLRISIPGLTLSCSRRTVTNMCMYLADTILRDRLIEI